MKIMCSFLYCTNTFSPIKMNKWDVFQWTQCFFLSLYIFSYYASMYNWLYEKYVNPFVGNTNSKNLYVNKYLFLPTLSSSLYHIAWLSLAIRLNCPSHSTGPVSAQSSCRKFQPVIQCLLRVKKSTEERRLTSSAVSRMSCLSDSNSFRDGN